MIHTNYTIDKLRSTSIKGFYLRYITKQRKGQGLHFFVKITLALTLRLFLLPNFIMLYIRNNIHLFISYDEETNS